MKLKKEKIYETAYNMIENFIDAFNKKNILSSRPTLV